jgi:hypothetical protein
MLGTEHEDSVLHRLKGCVRTGKRAHSELSDGWMYREEVELIESADTLFHCWIDDITTPESRSGNATSI